MNVEDDSIFQADDAPARQVQTVSELTASIRVLLEREFPRVRVEGEISNWMVAGSGHAYFAVKDTGALLSCVMWRSAVQRLGAPVRNGDKVELSGRISVYDKRGQYQLTVDSLKPAGEGALWQKFLELKGRLEAEGLFDEGRKRPIPRLPDRIGIVTSPTGAALRDILSVLRRRAPGVEILVAPARVQGDGAAAEIAHGIGLLARSGRVQVIIAGRGGGSLEDLWQFNEEAVARAVVASPVPVISAVGHEVDFTICDFASDLRAATPSAAAELVSGERQDVLRRAREGVDRLERAIARRLDDEYQRIGRALSSYAMREPETRIRMLQQETDDLARQLEGSIDRRMVAARHSVAAGRAGLAGHDPLLIVKKGYAIVRDPASGKVVTSAAALRVGKQMRTEFRDGVVRSIVVKDEADLFE